MSPLLPLSSPLSTVRLRSCRQAYASKQQTRSAGKTILAAAQELGRCLRVTGITAGVKGTASVRARGELPCLPQTQVALRRFQPYASRPAGASSVRLGATWTTWRLLLLGAVSRTVMAMRAISPAYAQT